MDYIEEFTKWAELDRRRSPNTIARYKATMAQLDDPINETLETIQAWWDSRFEMSPATRANELACLRAFYKWATRFDHRADDPTRRLDAPPIDNTVPRPIGESDLRRLFDFFAESPDLYRAVALGAYGGLRVGEAAGLEWKDIDQERRRIYVRGKGRKERVVGLNPVLLDKLLPVIDGNVVTGSKVSYSAATLQKKINRAFARAEVDHTFHDLRKRGATLAIAKTGDVYAVAKAFGWSSVETASTYAAVSDEALDHIANAML